MEHRLTLLVVNGHPDDESVNSGGILARYSAEGVRVVCVTGTRGERGEIVVEAMNTPENLARLGEIRTLELARALDHLGRIELVWLDYADSGVMGSPANDAPDSFWQADLADASARLLDVIDRVEADVIVAPNEYGGDGHPDHIKAGAIARAAFDRAVTRSRAAATHPNDTPWTPSKLYETVTQLDRRTKVLRLLAARDPRAVIRVGARYLARWRPGQDRTRSTMNAAQGQVTTRVDVGPWLDAKYAALAEHVSQISPDSREFALSPAERRLVAPTEDFTLRRSLVATRIPEDDLFAGLRDPVQMQPANRSTAAR